MAYSLYTEIRSKSALSYKERKALLSHWSPRVARLICRSIYPDFKGTYEQHLWLLTHKAAQGSSCYAHEAGQKGILFLWPYHYENMRLCGPSHYMYYVLKWQSAEVAAVLGGPRHRSERLNAKCLTEALRLHKVYSALPTPLSQRFDEAAPPAPSAAAFKARQKKSIALAASVKAQMMLTPKNLIEFRAIAYGWKRPV